jgi:hypothetical protein
MGGLPPGERSEVTRMRIVSFIGTIAAAIALVSASGAATGATPAAAKIDLSNKAKVHQYLRSIHVNPQGVVIQRGAKNYAGPHCPGTGWNCTTARKVIQIARTTATSAGRSFNATGGTNVASCVKLTGSNQTCSITQVALGSVSNKATVTQVIGQSGQSLNGTQGAQVTQTSVSGSNTVQLDQVIGQLSATLAASVNQSQNSTQTFDVSQTSTSGAQTLKATQTSGQAETASKAVTGTQFANGLLDAHFTQASAGLSTMTLTQTHAPVLQAKGPNVDQTVIDPMKCCSNQTGNPNDTVTITQNGIVKTSGDANPDISSLFQANCQSSGNCSATQTSNVNGVTNTNTASGSTISETFACSGSECTTGEIVFDGSAGTGAPPATLGGNSMTQFGLDPQALGSTVVSGVTDPAGTIGFAPGLSHTRVGQDWATWSNGYTGDVYYTGGNQITLTLPAGTKAFSFYAEPNQFAAFSVEATAQDGTTSGPIAVQGEAGAQNFGFYATGSQTLSSITVTTADPTGFAVGEFGINNGIIIT